MAVNRCLVMATNIVYSFLLAVVSALESAVRCTFVSFVMLTTPTMRKTNNPYFGRVQKRTSVKWGLFNATYIGRDANGNELPKNERGKEPLPWGKWRVFRKTIEHAGKVYMRVYTTKRSIVKEQCLLDGRVATPAEVAEIQSFISGGGSHKSDAHGKKTYTPDLNNIIYLRINGQVFDKSEYGFPKVG